jgi:thioesterase domain-containing protein
VGHGQGAAIAVEAARKMSQTGGGGGDVLSGVVLLDPVCGVRNKHMAVDTSVALAIESMEESARTLAKLSKLGVARIFMSLPNSIQTLVCSCVFFFFLFS